MKIICISLMWSAFIFIGYNILTAEATVEKDLRDTISGMKFVNDDLDDYGLKDIAIEQACEDNGGEWKDGAWCKFDKDEQANGDEVELEHQMAERGLDYYYNDKEALGEEWSKYEQEKSERSVEIAAQEDALCDNEDADTTDIKACMSEQKRELTQSKAFKSYVESQGITYDDYDNIAADEQLTIENDFKDAQHHEKDKQIESRVCEDEGGEYSQYGGCDTKGDDKKLEEIQEKVSQKLVEREEQEEDASAANEADVREYNPNDVDSDGDGIYNDEEQSLPNTSGYEHSTEVDIGEEVIKKN